MKLTPAGLFETTSRLHERVRTRTARVLLVATLFFAVAVTYFVVSLAFFGAEQPPYGYAYGPLIAVLLVLTGYLFSADVRIDRAKKTFAVQVAENLEERTGIRVEPWMIPIGNVPFAPIRDFVLAVGVRDGETGPVALRWVSDDEPISAEFGTEVLVHFA